MRTVTLRDERNGRDSRHLSAYLDDHGNLHIDGQDLGPSTSPVSSDGEYEWSRLICAEDIPHLLALLGAPKGASILDVLEQHWCGQKAGDLERRINASNLRVQLSTWSG
jgi:hypothetical protein